jgi:ubiquinone/menaquinone biosynthesis C-methylase UbiE
MSSEFWSKYATESGLHHNGEMSKFIRDLAVSLGSKNILEVGCSSGNDLSLFSNVSVSGADSNADAVRIAQQRFPDFEFKVAQIVDLPYGDASMDFVFTRNTLNYIRSEDLKRSFEELFRVSRRYIVNIERFSEGETKLGEDPPMFGRNVYKHWMDFKVKMISNVDMHEEIDPEKSRFTLVRKI